MAKLKPSGIFMDPLNKCEVRVLYCEPMQLVLYMMEQELEISAQIEETALSCVQRIFNRKTGVHFILVWFDKERITSLEDMSYIVHETFHLWHEILIQMYGDYEPIKICKENSEHYAYHIQGLFQSICSIVVPLFQRDPAI